MGEQYQLSGTIKIGPVGGSLVDVSDDVSSLIISRKRESIPKPATYGNPKKEARAGAIEDQITLVYSFSEVPSTGLWAVMWDALTNDNGELEFEAIYQDGAIGATNPGFTGIFTVVDMDAGSAVNTWKQQSKTYPARSITGPLSTFT